MELLPNTRLSPCPSCAELIRAGTSRCPHCDKDMSDGTGSVMCSLALLSASLTLAGCIWQAQPLYGVPDTEGGPTSESSGESSGGESSGSTTAPTTSGTMGGTEGTTGGTTTDGTGTSGGTSGTTDGSGTDGSSGTTGMTTGTSDQPLYGAVDPPNG